MRFRAENDRSQDAELTQIDRAICKILSKVGNASLRGKSSLNTSVVLFIVFLANVHLHNIDSILRVSLSKL